MTTRKKESDREDRIINEAIVDAYGPEEQAMGWYYYLDGRMRFPFMAKCVKKRAISPLAVGESVKVTGLAAEEECEKEMFAMIEWRDAKLGVPLVQLKTKKSDEDTTEAVEDWRYWIGRGYEF